MPSRQQLHELVDRIPEESTEAAGRMLAGLAADPVLLSLLIAPPDDEPISPELERRILDAVAEVDAGAKCYTTEELNRELGL
jgi:hypothetical protein